jgi:hypothetical protein
MITSPVSYLPGRDARGIRAIIFIVPALLIFCALAIGLAVGFTHNAPLVNATLVAMALMIPLIWRRPSLAVYVLVGGATLFETFVLGFPDSFTDRFLFFRSFKSAGGFSFLFITPSEALMGISVLMIMLKRMAEGQKPLKLGPLFIVVGFYIVMVCYGVVWGLGKGGNLEVAIWETRSQFYLLFMYLLVVNTFDSKSQITKLVWVILLAATFKGLVGLFRLIFTLGGDLDRISEVSHLGNSLLSHEDSFFFVIVLLCAGTFWLFRTGRDQFWATVLLAPPILISFLANQRRIGPLILGVGIIVVVLMAYSAMPDRRKIIKRVVLIGLAISPLYMAATWNMSGLIAEPTSAVKSVIAPDQRDASSNDYRVVETENLVINVQINPLMGRGYGNTIIQYIPLTYIGDGFPLWDVIPHNNLMWVWMRIGIVGVAAFWFMIGRSILGAALIAKGYDDRYLQAIGVMVIVTIVSWVVFGGLDMGIVNFRMTIIVGAMIGIVGALEEWGKFRNPEVEDAPVEKPRRVKQRSRVQTELFRGAR